MERRGNSTQDQIGSDGMCRRFQNHTKVRLSTRARTITYGDANRHIFPSIKIIFLSLDFNETFPVSKMKLMGGK